MIPAWQGTVIRRQRRLSLWRVHGIVKCRITRRRAPAVSTLKHSAAQRGLTSSQRSLHGRTHGDTDQPFWLKWTFLLSVWRVDLLKIYFYPQVHSCVTDKKLSHKSIKSWLQVHVSLRMFLVRLKHCISTISSPEMCQYNHSAWREATERWRDGDRKWSRWCRKEREISVIKRRFKDLRP